MELTKKKLPQICPAQKLRGVWRIGLVFLMLTMLFPVSALADENIGNYNNPSSAFTWSSKSQGCVHLKLQLTSTLDGSSYRDLKETVFTLTDEDGKSYDIFYLNETGTDNGSAKGYIENWMSDESLAYLTNEKGGIQYYIDGKDNKIIYQVKNAGGVAHPDSYVEIDWYYPYKFAGHKFTLSVKGKIWVGNSRTVDYSRSNICTIEFPRVGLDAYDPVPSYDEDSYGTLLLPIVSDRNINWIEVSYQDSLGIKHDIPRINYTGNSTYSDFIPLPSYEAHKNVTITANFTTTVMTEVLPYGSPTSFSGSTTINVGDVAMLHGPQWLHTTTTDDGAVELKWKISDVGFKDVVDGDQFIIERSMTGKENDFDIIGTEIFSNDQQMYSYTDSLLVSSLTPELIDKTLGIPLVRYRVYRATGQAMWGYEKNPALAYVQPVFSTFSLLKPKNPKAEWSDSNSEMEHKVKVTWDYEKSNYNTTYVWDNRAEMILDVMSYNRTGQLVESNSIVINKEQREKKEVMVTLARSCVNYELRMRVNAKDSPIGKGSGNIFIQIFDTEQLNTFKKRVSEGETELNVILMRDVDMGTEFIANDTNNPYRGNFNGNGHTINVDYSAGIDVAGLFRFVANDAVISNLNVTGKISSFRKFVGGLIGEVQSGTVNVENCSSRITIESDVDGDGTHGGLVGLITNSEANLRISNSLFRGQFIGENTTNCGGILGWRNNTCFAKITNTFFNPLYVYLSSAQGHATFMRSRNNNTEYIWGVIEDCFYNVPMGKPQGRKDSMISKSNWCWIGGEPMIESMSYSTPVANHEVNVSTPDHKFYFSNSGEVDKNSLTAKTLQSSVLLEWDNYEDGVVDFYEVMRKEKGTSEPYTVIATQLTDLQYEDKTVKPMHTYLYMVRSAVDCEGLSFAYTYEVEGNCVETCMIEGYVRFGDGTGVPGVSVTATPDETTPVTTGGSATTDETGYYCIKGLPYWKGMTGTYNITTNYTPGEILSAEFDDSSNHAIDKNFTVTNSIKFSGYVMFDGTSIPVQDVGFKVDGREVMTATGKVLTGFDGAFSFRILPGKHSIQAVKNGHTFWNDGFFMDGERNDVVLNTDKAEVYLYDQTRVKLIGRIAGGNAQGNIPLDNSLSKNNLGDNIKIVMSLEGDNTSWLVYDNTDTNLKERDVVFENGHHDQAEHNTRVHVTRHRLEITPDLKTGEYHVELPPVKWKITEISAQGYPTLFQNGKTGDVIDLTDALDVKTDYYYGSWITTTGISVTDPEVKYNAIYNRIYHNPVQLNRQQITYDSFDYFGDRYYNASDLAGNHDQVTLVRPEKKEGWPNDKEGGYEAKYTFGYPVFNAERTYPIKLSATETYYYNNDELFGEADVVKLSGGVVTVYNGLLGNAEPEKVELDENGEGIYKIKAKQTPYLLSEEQALSTLTMTLLMDGTYYEAEPLRAYVLNLVPKKGATDLVSINKPILLDILRDPPGGKSYAKLEKGSKYNYSFTLNYDFAAGAYPKIALGTSWNTWTGVGAGVYTKTNNWAEFGFEVVWNEKIQKAYNYTMTAISDICTSDNEKMMGADADVYIGVDNNITMTPAIAIRAIPISMYNDLRGEEAAGRLKVIAQGRDEKSRPVYLVRDEIMSYGTEVTSTFAHSQQYIINQLIPELEEQCKSLMFMGSKEEAKIQANHTGKPVYKSLRKPEDPQFGVMNTTKTLYEGDEEWEYYYNTDKENAEEGINYLIVLPDNYSSPVITDEVEQYSEALFTWYYMIAQNEYEKLTATKLMQNFDIDGGAPLTYSEEFGAVDSQSESKTNLTTNFIYGNTKQDTGTGFLMAYTLVEGIASKGAQKLLHYLLENKSSAKTSEPDDNGKTTVNVTGLNFDFDPGIIWNIELTPNYSQKNELTRKESFTIEMDRKSHLNFDVFYSESSNKDLESKDWNDVFYNGSYYNELDKVQDEIFNSRNGLQSVNPPEKRGFIYRTRGGATCRPYERERTTHIYKPGTVLDQATKKIENPVITMDRQSLSGVPMGEPARFKIYLANESEQPEAAYPYWELLLKEMTNPNGLKLMMDGMPLSGNPRIVEIEPGKVTEKTIEVYAGEEFDYENIGIRLRSKEDIHTWADTQFSVHFLHAAGAVNISSPGDKWIMNTDAPYDSKHGWYLPIVISGFDKNQHNFDHIEFQYKETTRGDDYWVNLCGFYKDQTLFDAASGTKEMIPENGFINTRFYGDGKEMEKGYDLRAVLFCRNGNDYLTNSSAVLSGVKDTRRPQLFGAVEPKDGILGSGDNIIFNFSEDIEHNYLSAITNFEIVGETNETAIQENPSLDFRGNGYAASQTRRNFTDKNFSIDVMIKPDKTGQDMPIFSHGIDGHNLQLWILADGKLKAVVDDNTLVSTKAVDTDYLNQVVMALDNSTGKLYLYNDSLIGSMDNVTYSGYGTLIFGSTNQSDVTKRSYYKGHMLEARVWNRALDKMLIDTYGKHQLTGYEMGLIDYYPMNEGEGMTAVDLSTGGADLTLTGTSWALPRGMSLYLNGKDESDVNGLQLKSDFIARTSEQDYTLMFWFRTDKTGRGALLSNGSGRSNDVNAHDRFFIGFEGETLKYRSNGDEYKLGDNYSDDTWHHYAMTVNRSHQVCNIYVDNVLKASFMTDNLGGMTGNNFFLGNMVWQEDGDNPDVKHYQNAFTGHIDELCLFKQALPTTLIKRYSKKSPRGSERGLVTYMGFNRQERTKQNDLELFPYALNQVITIDEDGVEHTSTDSIFVNSVDQIISQIDKTMGAPVQPFQNLKNLNFSFVGRDNQLLVNIDELDKKINKCTIHVTVTEIPDKNGNYMASPATASFFVNRNPLRWKTYNYIEKAFYGRESYLLANIVNTSGAEHTYTIEGLPRWMSVETNSNVIDPLDTQEVFFRISDEVNVGVYDEVIYLIDENGLAEPLRMQIVVEDDEPEWFVSPDLKRYSMNIVGQVSIGDAIVTNPNDIVAVFDNMGNCLGRANVDYNSETGLSLVFLTVYNKTNDPTALKFRLWHYDTGKIMLLTTSREIKFGDQTFEGTVKEPLKMTASDMYIQHFDLSPGWNWISFNVKNESLYNIANLLSMFDWIDGDILTEDSQDFTLTYKNGEWMSNSNADINNMALSNALSYRVKTQNGIIFDLEGTSLQQPIDRLISVKQGWNSIGYTPLVNLPVSTALAEYWSYAKDGDIIKSRDAFAQFYEGSSGATSWMGSLKYMKPGEGYMLYRQNEGNVTFLYPYYEPGSTTIDNVSHAPSRMSAHRTTMTMVAEAEGVDLQEGDHLVAYAAGEVVGEAEMSPNMDSSDTLFFLNITGEQEVPLSFTIERDNEIIAMTGNVMNYKPDGISGSLRMPTKIHFVQNDQMQQGEWYSIQGIKIGKRPTMRGIYIYNGKKQIIK